MTTVSPIRLGLLTFLCVMLLVVRVGGMHLHLCLDGGEPPVSLHGFDGGKHHAGVGAKLVHQDVDMPLSDDTLGQATKIKADLPILLIGVLVLLGLLFPCVAPPIATTSRITPSGHAFLRPPLRGPPLPFSP